MKIDSKQFIELVREAGHDVRKYSGRGMFGKQCIGVEDIPEWTLAMDLMSIADSDGPRHGDEIQQGDLAELRAPSQDSMGLGFILYWPELEWPEDVPEPGMEDDELEVSDPSYTDPEANR